MDNYNKETQKFATFGDKLLQHTDVLSEIQYRGIWKPITVQISLTPACESYCDFCSVRNRNMKFKFPFEKVKKVLEDFGCLGAKSVEFTGGGNPMLYPKINEVIDYAYELGYKIGIISNHGNPGKRLKKETAEKLSWYRCSLTKLEEGKTVNDYDFSIIPKGKLGFSHIINVKTTVKVIEDIAELVRRNSDVKFVRIAGNCLDPKSIETVKDKWNPIIKRVDKFGKFFIKEIGGCHTAYPDFCGVGPIRPYVYDDGHIYICTSHVLMKRRVLPEYRIGHADDILGMYKRMKSHFEETGKPYDINISKCGECFYHNNNKLLHAVVQGHNKFRMEDADFA